MLSRALPSLRTVQPRRGMATAQALRERVESVKSTQKITSAQKMIATFKLRKAQDNLTSARNFARSMDELNFIPEALEKENPKKNLFVGLTADKGFCGAINSSIVRAVRDKINAGTQAGTLEEPSIIVVGERGKGGLERLFKQFYVTTITEYEKVRNLGQCSAIVDYMLQQKVDKASVYYQKFVSMISYDTLEGAYWSYDAIKDSLEDQFSEYEKEGDADILQNLYEFKMNVKMFHYFAELDAATLSARMQAMDSASSNANDMIDALTLKLNRTRQAKITTELAEIISGAAAADDASE